MKKINKAFARLVFLTLLVSLAAYAFPDFIEASSSLSATVSAGGGSCSYGSASPSVLDYYKNDTVTLTVTDAASDTWAGGVVLKGLPGGDLLVGYHSSATRTFVAPNTNNFQVNIYENGPGACTNTVVSYITFGWNQTSSGSINCVSTTSTSATLSYNWAGTTAVAIYDQTQALRDMSPQNDVHDSKTVTVSQPAGTTNTYYLKDQTYQPVFSSPTYGQTTCATAASGIAGTTKTSTPPTSSNSAKPTLKAPSSSATYSPAASGVPETGNSKTPAYPPAPTSNSNQPTLVKAMTSMPSLAIGGIIVLGLILFALIKLNVMKLPINNK